VLRQRVQLGLVHIAVAITLVPINSTLNRVMIKELALSATLVAVLASLPYLFSPLQMAIGSFADRHPLFGWRRTPYIALGLLLCVAGVVLSPLAAYQMAENFWSGLFLGILVFGAWGMGFNFSTVSYLSLASELSGEKGRSRTISVMWFMMISGIIVTAITLSRLLSTYTPAAVETAFLVIGGVALVLGMLGLAGLEPRDTGKRAPNSQRQSWLDFGRAVAANPQARLFFVYLILLLGAILGQDILLEPFAGETFHLPVNETTRITSIWGVCVLISLLLAGLLEGRLSKRQVAVVGSVGAVGAFLLIALSGFLVNTPVFYSGVVLLGLATGIATVSNLSLMLDMTTAGSVGLFIGAWGMADALARGLGAIMSGVVRDTIASFSNNPSEGYIVVFLLQAGMLVISLWILRDLDISAFQSVEQASPALPLVERIALSNDG